MNSKLSFLILVAVSIISVSACSSSPKLTLAKKSFTPGEEIVLTYVALKEFAKNAWIGIIPSNIAHGDEAVNDQHDITYQYLNNATSGKMTFRAPVGIGNYDLRMHNTDNSGKEVASITFTVEGELPPSSIVLDKKFFKPGEAIQIKFTAPPTFAPNAWIGIIPNGVPHGNEGTNDQHDLAYQYIQKKTSGVMTFKAPQKPGEYDFRMHDTDNNGMETTSTTFKVE
ncbi:MAG: hypothetical protein HN337_00125 [Deltaproteobacteria bacterium]|jgi:hypothetical protein|nr:hypothetical protein [Deltaproteobacteria bacterium]